MIGAGDLNERFRILVTEILRKERYLTNSGVSIDSIVAAECMPKFESRFKRGFLYNDTEATYDIHIRDLEESRTDKRVRKNFLVLT